MASLDFNTRSLTELPDAVILDILLKLPIKSIRVCRCVCKSLYKLTFDPFFTRNYFTNPPFTRAVCQYKWPADSQGFYLLEIERDCDHVIRTPFHPKALSFNTNGTLRVCGSCNGLLCLVQDISVQHNNFLREKMTEETAYIVNPLLGEFTRLPKIKICDTRSRYYEVIVNHYFGCTREANRYKVLRVATSREFVILHAEVFTIGVDDEWRSLNDSFPPTLEFQNCHDVYFNGVIHFLSWLPFIFCFDVEEERVKRISLPPGIGDRGEALVVLNDKLCYTESNCDGGIIKIWVMKEHGVGESWSKEIILGSWIPSEPYYLRQFFTSSVDRDLLMCSTRRWNLNTILSLDPCAKVCRSYEVIGADIEPYVPRFSHTPTHDQPLNFL